MMRRTVLGTVGLAFTQVLCSSAPTSHSQRLSRTTSASSTLIRSACRLGGGRQQQDRQRVAFPPPTLGATGAVDDDFRGRAICSIGGIICNDATEAVYIVAFADVDGQKLDGANRYTMRFEKGALPQSYRGRSIIWWVKIAWFQIVKAALCRKLNQLSSYQRQLRANTIFPGRADQRVECRQASRRLDFPNRRQGSAGNIADHCRRRHVCDDSFQPRLCTQCQDRRRILALQARDGSGHDLMLWPN